MLKHKSIRKIHFWATLFVMVPLFIMTISGIILMFKKQSTWIQPPTQKGSTQIPTVLFETILDSLKNSDKVMVSSWEDVSRIDVRPSKGVGKVRLEGGLEVQVDLGDGSILQVMKRRSDIIEDIHTGGYWGDWMKFGVFTTAAVVFFIQLLTGIYLFFRPYFVKLHRKKLLMEEVASVE